MRSETQVRRRRRTFAINIVMTIFGGVILFLFLLLIGLLYWMYADVHLPEPARVIHPKATAYLVMNWPHPPAPSSNIGEQAAALLSAGLPPQAARFVEKGIEQGACQVRIVASVTPTSTTNDLLLAICLAKFPGQFHLVRRDLQRRGIAAMRRRGEQAVFTLPDAEQLPMLSLTRCSVLRGAEFDNVASLVDGLLAESVPAGAWPDPDEVRSEYSGAADYWGWAGTWPKVPLARILPQETKAKMQTFETELLSVFPELGNAQDFRFWGQISPPGFPLRISFKAPDSEEAVLLVKGLPEWLKQHGGKVGIVSASASFDARTERITMELHMVQVEN